MMDLENILRLHLEDVSLWWKSGKKDSIDINFFIDGRADDQDRYLEFRRNAINTPLHFIQGEYMGASINGVDVKLSKSNGGRTISLKLKPGDLIIGCDGARRFFLGLTTIAPFGKRHLPQRIYRSKVWRLITVRPSLMMSSKLKESITASTFKNVHKLIETLPSVHRLRVFRQQNSQFYLGVNLSPIEYELLSMGRYAPGFWEEIHQLLKGYGLFVSGIIYLLSFSS
jgi:hypothetical protein